jgi:hypothetical protein
MACGCSKRNRVTPEGKVAGFYVILPDGTKRPNVDAGEAPFISAGEAHAVVRKHGGGTFRAMKRERAR